MFRVWDSRIEVQGFALSDLDSKACRREFAFHGLGINDQQ